MGVLWPQLSKALKVVVATEFGSDKTNTCFSQQNKSFVATKLCKSPVRSFVANKRTFVATKDVFCREKHVFVPKLLSRQNFYL